MIETHASRVNGSICKVKRISSHLSQSGFVRELIITLGLGEKTTDYGWKCYPSRLR